MGTLAAARQFALSLPGTSEEPHFELTSFRVRGKIFATAPPDASYLNLFVDPDEVTGYVAEDGTAFEPLHWGRQVRGLRVRLAAVTDPRVAELLDGAWRRKAPRRLISQYDEERQ